MQLARSLKVGAWLFICLNLLMAFGSIGVFMRMTPAIEVIIDRNERSLQACEDMLVVLATLTSDKQTNHAQAREFARALAHAKNNITEDHEIEAIAIIEREYPAALLVNLAAKHNTVAAIVSLAHTNRGAMINADKQAKQLGYAGAWGVVFMAIGIFFSAMVLMRSLRKNLVAPLAQIHAVVSAQLDGDSQRRCSGADLPRDIKIIYDGLNELFDKNQEHAAATKWR